MEHGESNSSLALAPQALRDLLDRFTRAVGPLESPAVVITSSSVPVFSAAGAGIVDSESVFPFAQRDSGGNQSDIAGSDSV